MLGNNLDLSSFPLLRIDELCNHETKTLEASDAQLVVLQQSDDVETIVPFITKLREHIRKELSNRVLSNDTVNPKQQQTPQRKPICLRQDRSSAKSPRRNKRVNVSPIRSESKHRPMLSFFVPSSQESGNTSFYARSKQVKASLQARSHDAIDSEGIRKNRARKALEKMKEWRLGREQSKQRREELLEEERRAARVHRRERRQREERVTSSMEAAAEEAKSLALQKGSSREEAILEAAAAAARIVDDQSTIFESDDGDSVVDVDIDENTAYSADGAIPRDRSDGGSSDGSNHSPDESVRSDGKNLELEGDDVNGASNAYEDLDEDNSMLNHVDEVDCGDVAQYEIDDITDVETSEIIQIPTSLDYAASNPESTKKELEPAQEVNDVRTDKNAPLLSALPPQHLDEHKDVPFQSNDEQVDLSYSHSSQSNDPAAHKHEDVKVQYKTSQPSKFTNAFPSFFHTFSRFTNGRRSNADDKDLGKCMHSVVERCSNMEMLIEPEHDNNELALFYHIKSNRPEIVDILSTCFSDRCMAQWEEGSVDTLWNLMWTWGMPKAADFDHLLVFQKVSRFRNTRGLTRKDLLNKSIQRCVGISDRATMESFNIMPLTYALPHEFNNFVKGFSSIQNASGDKKSNFWIIKPIGLSRGRGISLVDRISDVSYSQPIVIQKYIADPLCFMGYKFDLRVYVLVTSFNPLESFIYKEGLARFGSRQYSASPANLHDLRIHLTNSSIQKAFGCEIDKGHPAYLAGSRGAESKVAMTWLFNRLGELGIDSKLLWKKVVEVCKKALIAGGSDIPHQPNCFELFGFDVMFDENLKCWLIEVNSSPSMSCDTHLDTRIKGNLIRDTVLLVDPPPLNQSALIEVCQRRLTHRKEESSKSSRAILDQDLRRILNHRLPRVYGEMPRLGKFERIAPDIKVDK